MVEYGRQRQLSSGRRRQYSARWIAERICVKAESAQGILSCFADGRRKVL